MIKVAIIGSGAIAHSHIEGYLQFRDRCKIVAICDLYPDKAEALRKQYGLDAKVMKEHDGVLQEDVDLISICTPPYTHADIAVDALYAGKHVIVEKPMASSLEECDRMNKAATASGNILSVISQNRFGDGIMKLKQVLASGLAGRIVHAQVDSYWWRGYSYYDLWWRGTWEKEGGGCTLNHAVHHIDMLQWLLGMPEQVTAVMSNTAHDNAEVEDLSIAILSYPRALAQITSSVVNHGQEQQLIFQGEKARISMPWKVVASVSKENGFPEVNKALEDEINRLADQVPALRYTGHKGQLDDVLTAIESGSGSVLVTGQEGRRTLELITAIYQSASTGSAVRLPLQPDSPFYTREGILASAPRYFKKKKALTSFTSNEITVSGNPEE